MRMNHYFSINPLTIHQDISQVQPLIAEMDPESKNHEGKTQTIKDWYSSDAQ